jgi:hypothetical protein
VTDIALRQDTAPVVPQVDPTGGRLVAWAHAAQAANQLAKALCTTTFAPKHFRDNPGDTTAAIIAGDELGLSPLASMRSLYVIHGTPAMYAKTMVALVQSHGHQVWTEKTGDDEVVVCGQRRGSARVERASWTITRAKKAGYTSNAKYTSNPQQMLYAKAASEVCNKVAADVLLGIGATVEDMELEEPATTTVSRPPAAPRTTVSRRKAAPAPEPEEPTFDEPATEPEAQEQQPAGITDPQLKMLHALFTEKDFKERDDRIDYVRAVLDDDGIESSKELTKDQASRVIDALQQLPGGAE